MKDYKLQTLRAIDKLNRLGGAAVLELLTVGRRDKSGDFTPGVGWSLVQAAFILRLCGCTVDIACYRPDIQSAIVVVGK